jgi:transcription elongation factor GreA
MTEAITSEGLAALRAEVEELEGPARARMAERIKAARELGDLKENAEYHLAKNDQAHLETRIKVLRDRLHRAQVVEVDAGAPVFSFGRTAVVVDEANGEDRTWTLVGSSESDLSQGRLSAESPIGRALRDRRPGETVRVSTPAGERAFSIRELVD